MAGTAILLGDSIIDNALYVGPGGRDVASYVGEFAGDIDVEMRARDGSRCVEVLREQLDRRPPADARLVLSVGGNDALAEIGRLNSLDKLTFAEAMIALREIREGFRAGYRELLDTVAAFERPVLVLTIYNPRFGLLDSSEEEQWAAEGALSAFNDVIQQEASRRGFDVLDIRHVFVEDGDYYNPIEPSEGGGRKLAAAIAGWLASH